MKPENKGVMMKTPIALCLFAQILSFAALAQSTGSNGGGDDVVFKQHRNELAGWVAKNQEVGRLSSKLKLQTLTGAELQARFADAAAKVGERIVFNHERIVFVDRQGRENVRVCKNEIDTITCNIEEWRGLKDGRLRYAIVFHEYLGIAGIETNQETPYSQYPISSQILRFVRSVEAFELGMDPVDGLAGDGSLRDRFIIGTMPGMDFLVNVHRLTESYGRWNCYRDGKFVFFIHIIGSYQKKALFNWTYPEMPLVENTRANAVVFEMADRLRFFSLRRNGDSLLLEFSRTPSSREVRRNPRHARSVLDPSLFLVGYYECRPRTE
jgi:hypothetical protein